MATLVGLFALAVGVLFLAHRGLGEPDLRLNIERSGWPPWRPQPLDSVQGDPTAQAIESSERGS